LGAKTDHQLLAFFLLKKYKSVIRIEAVEVGLEAVNASRTLKLP
jgi:hypothetical protein